MKVKFAYLENLVYLCTRLLASRLKCFVFFVQFVGRNEYTFDKRTKLKALMLLQYKNARKKQFFRDYGSR